jgi:hypothetical protein
MVTPEGLTAKDDPENKNLSPGDLLAFHFEALDPLTRRFELKR